MLEASSYVAKKIFEVIKFFSVETNLCNNSKEEHKPSPIDILLNSQRFTSPSVALPFPQTASYIYDSTRPPTA